MPTPLDQQQQQQPPPLAVTEQAYSSHTGHGSVGPVIAVLAVITTLGAIAGMIGRLCAGGRIFGHGDYDFESWVQSKCISCPQRFQLQCRWRWWKAIKKSKKNKKNRGRRKRQRQTLYKPHESSSQS